MTELERLELENLYLKAENCCSKKVEGATVEGGKRERRKTENCSRINQ